MYELLMSFNLTQFSRQGIFSLEKTLIYLLLIELQLYFTQDFCSENNSKSLTPMALILIKLLIMLKLYCHKHPRAKNYTHNNLNNNQYNQKNNFRT